MPMQLWWRRWQLVLAVDAAKMASDVKAIVIVKAIGAHCDSIEGNVCWRCDRGECGMCKRRV
ncbi:hypothetical protein DPMN_014429 [Dreissena polymorpha]|uniref:Uncharacterized protein n=1 Tax=Dreissena polymorpha TaxID=45954 RepID=A0A9D4N9P3_DREPO|nr:hypothetical protein DPMN_014429 [Dreissena polymorpha]